MLMDRSTKLLIAIASLVASTFLTVKHIITEDPIEEWLLAGILFLLSAGFWVWIWLEDQKEEEESGITLSTTDTQPQEWIISKDVSAAEQAVKAVEQAGDAVKQETAKTETVTAVDPQPVESEDLGDTSDEASEDSVETSTGETVTQSEVVAELVESEDGESDVVEAVKNGEAPEEAVVAEATSAPVVEASEDEAQVTPDETPVDTSADTDEPDDLTKVEGIGPKYSAALISAGIATFSQLAESSMETLEKIVSDAGMRRPRSIETWAEQAELAAKGDWDALEKLQDELDGGRRK